MQEIWKPVVGYEGFYEVSNLGNVRAVDRVVIKSDGVAQPRRGHEMVKTVNDDGYFTVKLSKDGESRRVFVHRLVALAFVPNPDNMQEVNHKDFNRANPRADNLEWTSHKDNVHYSINAGRHYCNKDLTGKNNPNYQGTALKEYYANHPEERQKLSRKGKQNGMAKPVEIIFNDGTALRFGYLRECADYLICNGLSRSKNRDVVSLNISKSIKNKTSYCNCHFNRV